MVFILSEHDDPTMDRIIKWLNFYKCEYLRLTNISKVTLKEIYLTDNLSENYINIIINKSDYKINKDSTFFIRRGYIIFENISNDVQKKFIREWLNNEIKSIYDYIYSFIENKTSLCIGSLLNSNINKLLQLQLASEVGFKIPQTIITSEHYDYSLFFGKNIITKPVSNIFVEKDDYYKYISNGTNTVDVRKLISNPVKFPSLFQYNIEKLIEIRVFFFLENYYAVGTINYNKKKYTKVDWRYYCGKIGKLRYFPLKLPNVVINKLKLLSKKFKINTGSYDLLFDGEKYYFIEVNTHGQFGFVSMAGNYYIESEIAKTLFMADKK